MKRHIRLYEIEQNPLYHLIFFFISCKIVFVKVYLGILDPKDAKTKKNRKALLPLQEDL